MFLPRCNCHIEVGKPKLERTKAESSIYSATNLWLYRLRHFLHPNGSEPKGYDTFLQFKMTEDVGQHML